MSTGNSEIIWTYQTPMQPGVWWYQDGNTVKRLIRLSLHHGRDGKFYLIVNYQWYVKAEDMKGRWSTAPEVAHMLLGGQWINP